MMEDIGITLGFYKFGRHLLRHSHPGAAAAVQTVGDIQSHLESLNLDSTSPKTA